MPIAEPHSGFFTFAFFLVRLARRRPSAKGIVARMGRDSGTEARCAKRIEPGPRVRADSPRPSPNLRPSWLRFHSNTRDNFSVRRAGDTASVMTVLPDGSIEWRNKEGKYHREDGPAREWPAQGAKAWYRNGKLHRDDGPAMAPGGRRWIVLLAKAGTAKESGIAKRGQPSNMPTAEKSGTAMARSLPPLSSLLSGRRNFAEIDLIKDRLKRLKEMLR
jgi:hypothetical protein